MADFVLALARFDQEKRWRELEYASLFAFLRSGLGLSAGAAQYRKTAAELVQRYPQVEDALREGKLCLSSVIELAKVLTPENVSEVLPRFFGLSSRDAAAVAVSIRPVEHPPEREVVTILRPVAPGLPRVSEVRAPEVPVSETMNPPASLAVVGTTIEPRPSVDPLDAERARLHIERASSRSRARLPPRRFAPRRSPPP